jgi:hypothetical protein
VDALARRGPDRLRVLAIEGKTLRGVGVHGDRTLHLVHVWATEARVLLSMTATAGAPGEPEATRAMLEWLDVRGAILTTGDDHEEARLMPSSA